MPKFKQEVAEENGWTEDIFPIMRGYKMACCDCGLVHDIDIDVFEIKKFNKDGTFRGRRRWGKRWRVALRVRRNNRSTGQIRRHRRKDDA